MATASPQWAPDVAKEMQVTRPSQLETKDYFKSVKTMELKRGLKVGLYGESETGKSYFGMTCPPPVFVIDTEFAAVKLAKQHFPQKDIQVCEVKVISEETMQPDPIRSMYEFENAIVSLKGIEKGTIAVDNITDYWQYVRAWMETQASKK